MTSPVNYISSCIQCDGTGRDTYILRDPCNLNGMRHVPKDSPARWTDNLRNHVVRHQYSGSVSSSTRRSTSAGSSTVSRSSTVSDGVSSNQDGGGLRAAKHLHRTASAPGNVGKGTAHDPAIPKSPWLQQRPQSRGGRAASQLSATTSRDRSAQKADAPGHHSAVRAMARAAAASNRTQEKAPNRKPRRAVSSQKTAGRVTSQRAENMWQELQAAYPSRSAHSPRHVHPSVARESQLGHAQGDVILRKVPEVHVPLHIKAPPGYVLVGVESDANGQPQYLFVPQDTENAAHGTRAATLRRSGSAPAARKPMSRGAYAHK